MKIMIVTDAWSPQVNGVVTTLGKIGEGLNRLSHEVRFVTPQMFKSIPCPTYPEIRLSLLPYSGISREIERFKPDAIHIATEGPLGMAARRYCLKKGAQLRRTILLAGVRQPVPRPSLADCATTRGLAPNASSNSALKARAGEHSSPKFSCVNRCVIAFSRVFLRFCRRPSLRLCAMPS